MSDQLQFRKHHRYFVRHLNSFPGQYSSLDSTRLTMLYFAVSGLDLLDEVEKVFDAEQKAKLIDWIYSLQLTSETGCPASYCGFRGSHTVATAKPNEDDQPDGDRPWNKYDHANLAQTYSALLSLLVLGDDLSRVDRRAVLEAIRLAQRDDGCFWAQGPGSECDMRFVYCAVAICHLLGDFVTIDWTKLASFLRASFSYEGGFGQGPMDEGHGGSTYCAVAALSLGGKLWDGSVLSDKDIKLLTKWVLNKQEAGFHGRSGKPDDTCYAFWLGATLKILGAYHLCDAARIRTFLLSAQHNHMGGFAKLPEPGMHSDLLHSYFSLAALAIQGEPTLSVINPSANISQRTYERLMKLRFD